MTTIINHLKKFQGLLKDKELDLIDLYSEFGALESSLLALNNNKINEHIKEISELLEKLYDDKDKDKQKLYIALKIGAIIKEVENIDNHDSSIKSALATGTAAVVGARALLKAGPLGMLAAGVLGVAGGLLLAKENNQRPLDSTGVLTIAYYLSMYDHHDLFGKGISAIKAFEAIGSVINVSHNTLKSRRDCFDSLIPKEKRVNKKRDSNLCSESNAFEYKKIIKEYDGYDEEKMRRKIEDILENYQKKEVR